MADDFIDDSDLGVDVTRLIGIMDLNDNTCRFPVGDPLQPGFGFCGAHVASVPEGERRPVYCEFHMQAAYHRAA